MNINGRKVISYFGITKSHFIHDNRSHQISVVYLNALAWLVGDLSKPFPFITEWASWKNKNNFKMPQSNYKQSQYEYLI